LADVIDEVDDHAHRFDEGKTKNQIHSNIGTSGDK
jgi:hypothetical protein